MALEKHLETVLAVLVGDATVSTLVKAVRAVFGPKALRTNDRPNPRVRSACEALVKRGVLVRVERGHTYYGMRGEVALHLLRAHSVSTLHGWARSLEDPRRPFWNLAGNPTWWAEARIAVVAEDPALIRGVERHRHFRLLHPDDEAVGWVNAAGTTPPPGLLDHLQPKVADAFCMLSLEVSRSVWSPVAKEVIEHISGKQAKPRRELAGYLALRGDLEAARALAGSSKETQAGIAVIEAFFRGALREAADIGLAACATFKRKHKVLTGEAGVLHALACIAVSNEDPRGMPHAQAAIGALESRRRTYEPCYAALIPAVEQEPGARRFFDYAREASDGLAVYVLALAQLWVYDANEDPPPELPEEWAYWKAQAASAPTLAGMMRELEEAYAQPGAPTGLPGAFVRRAAWAIALDALEVSIRSLGETETTNSKKDAIVWVVEGEDTDLTIVPRLRGPRSRKGRKVSLLTLLEKAESDELSATRQDQAVLDGCVVDRHEWTGRRFAQLTLRSLSALVGHPRVAGPGGESLSVVRGTPRLVLDRTAQGASLRLHPPQLRDTSVLLAREGDTVELYERPAAWNALLEDLQTSTLEVPNSGVARLERLTATLAERGSLAVEGLSSGENAIEADPRLLARLTWDGDTLRVEICGAPFGTDGPHYPVGEGTEHAIRQGAEGLETAKRDLEDEQRRLRELQAVLPGDWAGHTERTLADLEEALALVETLDGLGDTITRAWSGKALTVRSSGSATDALQIKVRKADEWFAADATLAVDDERVLGYAQLLHGRRSGARYIALGENEYLALTAEMTRRLDTLRAFASDKDAAVHLHPAVMESVGLTEDAPGVVFDKATKTHLKAIHKARTLQPRLPRSFAATLRPYQRDGFRWLARLCAAGLGGCLADDMGLGKTVQTLALLCLRQKEGPALVICPTSVVANWQEETARFAPKLRVCTLGATGRRETLEGLRKGDVLITSYGLLVREQEALAEVSFGTLVFDEAHALKTPTSQRAKAGFALTAKARVTLTGTPIENHLGELWSVMHASVPGLLGSKRQFDERLGRPVLKHHPGALERLRDILDPFVLRRRRAEVLTELPELTEVTLRVPPTDAQAAYYEAVRQRAMAALRAARKNPQKARLQVLAEIMRLRQAAIDPRLLDEDLAPAGAKLDEACRRIAALHADGHRCLVFTQFLGCIERLDAQLSDLGLEVLTLDGSTPAALRKARIDAFQRGEADAFVMSLKAGGVGINLTAAQYVIHMDPWWNPAVEEQATARSHRMGQHQPVTVYRMITEGSIEEQILELHARKRGLAEDLLGGMESARPLDLETLGELLGG